MLDPMSVVVNHVDGEVVLTVHGEVDIATAPTLRVAVSTEDPCLRFVFDLAGVTFMDSSGLAVIAQAALSSRQSSGSVSLRNTPPMVRRLLEVAALDPFVKVEGDAADAERPGDPVPHS